MTHEELKNLLKDIVGVYPRFPYAGDQTVDAWWKRLKDVPADRVMKQYERWIKSGNKNAPQLSDLLMPEQRQIVYAGRPPLHYNRYGELEDDEGRLYAFPG